MWHASITALNLNNDQLARDWERFNPSWSRTTPTVIKRTLDFLPVYVQSPPLELENSGWDYSPVSVSLVKQRVDLGRRLMNGADDRFASGRHRVQSLNDSFCHERIEARRRFVTEEQRWVRQGFRSKRQTFPLTTGNSDYSPGISNLSVCTFAQAELSDRKNLTIEAVMEPVGFQYLGSFCNDMVCWLKSIPNDFLNLLLKCRPRMIESL